MAGHILIAEHDVGLGQALARCLRVHGYDVSVTANALECITEIRTSVPEVLILDPQILWGGAVGVLQWLADEDSIKVTKIAIVDGHDSISLPAGLGESLGVSRLRRPCEMCELLPFVHEIEGLTGPTP